MLFKSIEEIKTYVPNTSSNLETMQPHIIDAELEYLVPLIGQSFYDAFNTAFQDNTLPEAETKLLPYLQAPVAKLSYYIGLGQLNVNITDSGILIEENADRKAANPWHIDDLRRDFCVLGHKSLDHFLLYLETNADSFPDWKASDYYTLSRKTFVCSTQDYNDVVFINNSRQTFLALRQVMLRIQKNRLKKHIGAAFYAELLTRHIASEYTTGDAELLEFIVPATAHLAAATALKELNVESTANGLQVNSFRPRVQNKKGAAPEDALLARRIQESELLGEAALQDLSDYLNANASADLYATYFNSDIYSDPTASTTFQNNEGGTYAAF